MVKDVNPVDQFTTSFDTNATEETAATDEAAPVLEVTEEATETATEEAPEAN